MAAAAVKPAAGALGGKTARACDSCLRRRARWYCAADDAFLCQVCDSSVHSANQLARRHERIRLETASSKDGSALTNPIFADNTVPPAWHHGFTRKARTPRNKKSELDRVPKGDLVPEISSEFDTLITDDNELEDQFFCRVPEFDPFVCDLDINELFLPTELDLAEFAADVESLLGKGVEDREVVKVKGEVELEEEEEGAAFVFGDCGTGGGGWGGLVEEDEKKGIEEEEKKKMLLKLNYEDVMVAWACQGSPWTTGSRPDVEAGDGWPAGCMGTCGPDVNQNPYGEAMGLMKAHGADNKGREARVSRYREKRRTRMFSKKIRYQVRKLNAEKRPRMKGRFVKRTSSSFPLMNM